MLKLQLQGPDLSLPSSQIKEFRSAINELHFETDRDSKFRRDFQKYGTTDYDKEVLKSLAKMQEIIEDRKEIAEIQNELAFYEFMSSMQSEKYKEMQVFREQLPSFAKRQEIMEMISNNQVILIKGETGENICYIA